MTTMPGPSAHLTWDELRCRDRMRTAYPLDYRTDPTRLPRLAEAFEQVRGMWGVPLRVLSAYRTPAYNRQIGGAARSQHVEGRALDLQPPGDLTAREFFAAVVRLAAARPDLGIRYVQGYGTRGFVHIDVRPTEALATKWEA